MTMRVVFDVDGVLACNQVPDIYTAAFFKNKGAIFTAEKTVYVFPGAIEALQLFLSSAQSKAGFFSSAAKLRNRPLVDFLLQKAHSEAFREQVPVLSKEDLSSASREQKINLDKMFGIFPGRFFKDLSLLSTENERIEDLILVEDNMSYVSPKQIANVVRLPEVKGDYFQRMESKVTRYEPDGYRYLEYFYAPSEMEVGWGKSSVEEDNTVDVIRTEEGFDIAFLDKYSLAYRRESIDGSKATDLIHRLKELTTKTKSRVIKDKSLKELISQWIESQDGVARKISRKVNTVFFFVGLILTAQHKALKDNISVSKALYSLQYDEFQGKPVFKKRLREVHGFYQLGLNALRTINPNLQFTSPHEYKRITDLPLSDEDSAFLKESFGNAAFGGVF